MALVDSVLYSGYCNVSCCVVILVAVVDSVCFMLCCLVTVVVVDSVCFMLCCVFSGYNEFCMFHVVFFFYNDNSRFYFCHAVLYLQWR